MEALSFMAIASVVIVVTSAIWALAPLVGAIGHGSLRYALQRIRMSMLRLPERKSVWGIVYDSDTKRPIPFAKIQLIDEHNRVLETRVADGEGKYGFLTRPESIIVERDRTIRLSPSASGYEFPSHAVPTVDHHIYGDRYTGQRIDVRQDMLVNFDIPMDPLRRSSRPLIVKSPSVALGAYTAAVADAGFWLGLVLVPLNAILSPNPFSFGVLFLYLGTASLRIWGITERPYGVVTDAQTGRAMPFALITLDDDGGRRVAHTVSDEHGRYFLATGRGTYTMTVHTPAPVLPPRQFREVIEARKGWITRAVKL